MIENTEIGIHTEKSSKTTLIRSIEIMTGQLAKFTFENKTAADKMKAVEKQTTSYRLNLDPLHQKVLKLDEQINRASPIIGRMKKDHDMCKEQYQEAKKQMLNFQLSVNNEETAIHDLQNKMEMQKKHIQYIIKRIGKIHKGLKTKETTVKSSKGKEKKRKSDKSNLIKSKIYNEKMSNPSKSKNYDEKMSNPTKSKNYDEKMSNPIKSKNYD